MELFHFHRTETREFCQATIMDRNLFFSMVILLLLTACAAPPQTAYPANTPDPLQPYMDASASKGTAVAAVATAEYFSMQLTATVETRNQIGTQQAASANALATERAWNATSTADSILATGTASAVAQQAIWTQRAMDVTATANSASVQAFATEQYSRARSNELSIQRKEMMNSVVAVVPWGVGVGTLAIALLVLVRWSRVRIIQRDPRGDSPLLLNVVDGVAYDFDRHPTSTGGLQRQDIKLLPKFSASDHTQTAERDQMLDLATRGFQNSSRRRPAPLEPLRSNLPQHTSSTSAPNFAPKIEVIDVSQAKPLFHDVIGHIVRDAIEAEIIEGEPNDTHHSPS
jgi:hypothetical protein